MANVCIIIGDVYNFYRPLSYPFGSLGRFYVFPPFCDIVQLKVGGYIFTILKRIPIEVRTMKFDSKTDFLRVQYILIMDASVDSRGSVYKETEIYNLKPSQNLCKASLK